MEILYIQLVSWLVDSKTKTEKLEKSVSKGIKERQGDISS